MENKNADALRANTLGKIDGINAVEGFDPSLLTEQYDITDSETGEVTKTNVLPARVRIAWFRLVYREGKISVTVKQEGTGRFTAEAKVYRRYDDLPENYLANAIISRYQPQNSLISPREWAQTAAVSKALCNAGFRLSNEIFSDELDASLRGAGEGSDDANSPLEDESDVVNDTATVPGEDVPKRRGRPKKEYDPVKAVLDGTSVTDSAAAAEAEDPPTEPEMTSDDITPEMLDWAMNLQWKTSEKSKTAVFNGKPMKEMLQSEDGCKILKWAAGKDSLGDFSKAAKILCLKAQE